MKNAAPQALDPTGAAPKPVTACAVPAVAACLFAIEGLGYYGGGLAIVRAKTKEQAIEFASKINDPDWRTDYSRPSEVVELSETADGVLHHFETGE